MAGWETFSEMPVLEQQTINSSLQQAFFTLILNTMLIMPVILKGVARLVTQGHK